MMRVIRDPRLGMVWLAARLWIGWTFLHAGWDKVTGTGWLSSTTGIDGFLHASASTQMTGGTHASVSNWFATLVNHIFLPIDGFLSYLVPIGEIAVGVGLMLGCFTLTAAFFGALLNMLFMLGGSLSASENPIMFGLGLLLMVAGPAAYVYGVDRVMLPALRRQWTRHQLPRMHMPQPLAH